jgi:dienelactone hydrolase
MQASLRKRAPSATLSGFEREVFTSHGYRHPVWRKGHGPAVLVLAEIPGITPQLLGFAERIVAVGCTAIVPELFGTTGWDPRTGPKYYAYARTLAVALRACLNPAFNAFALAKTAPVVAWLRSLAAHEHSRCGGPGVGVIGMCFTGGFALAMASDPRVLAPVLAQPLLPLGLTPGHRHSIDCSQEDLARIAARCETEGVRVLGLRFKSDLLSPAERFRYLRERLGEGFIALELARESGHPDGPLPSPHSVFIADLIDEPGEPTRVALEQVLAFFRDQLLGQAIQITA